jgi:glutamate/tyrosine decarboxylase-like PLP-dependent enzyme
VKGLGDWELLNMPTRAALDLADKVKKAGCFEEVRNETVRGNGAGEGKLGVVLVPQSKHYSWVKAADVLGIGGKNLVEVQVDGDFRMDVGALEKAIRGHAKKGVPVMAVVAVLGSTEEGAIDRVAEIARLRRRLEKEGISFYFHVDAAYGGYSRALFLDENNRFMGLEEFRRRALSRQALSGDTGYPKKEVFEAYKAVPEADSVTIDPHKMGYIPYSAGGIAIKDRRVLDLVSYFAAYVFEAGKTSPALLGAYIMEGSKAGATAAAVWAAHRVIPLNVTGYGQIIGRSVEGARMFSRALESVKSLKAGGKEYVVQPLVREPDFNIICMAFNRKGNRNLDEMNALNEAIYDEASYVRGPVYLNDWITSNTDLSVEDYGNAPEGFVGRLGIPASEWKRVGHVHVLRVCMLNPFISGAGDSGEMWKRFMGIMEEKLACAAARCGKTPRAHSRRH